MMRTLRRSQQPLDSLNATSIPGSSTMFAAELFMNPLLEIACDRHITLLRLRENIGLALTTRRLLFIAVDHHSHGLNAFRRCLPMTARRLEQGSFKSISRVTTVPLANHAPGSGPFDVGALDPSRGSSVVASAFLLLGFCQGIVTGADFDIAVA
ncbi:hypothetical protein ACKLNR_009797 [Fusarium oxysporum f. sp. zingiberi]